MSENDPIMELGRIAARGQEVQGKFMQEVCDLVQDWIMKTAAEERIPAGTVALMASRVLMSNSLTFAGTALQDQTRERRERMLAAIREAAESDAEASIIENSKRHGPKVAPAPEGTPNPSSPWAK